MGSWSKIQHCFCSFVCFPFHRETRTWREKSPELHSHIGEFVLWRKWAREDIPGNFLSAALYLVVCKAQHRQARKAVGKCISAGGTVMVLKVQGSINNKRQANLQAQLLTFRSDVIRGWIQTGLAQERAFRIPDDPFTPGELGTSLLEDFKTLSDHERYLKSNAV